jgi:oligopeptide transport system substrate-binding protein
MNSIVPQRAKSNCGMWVIWQTSALAALLMILLAGCAAPWPFPQPTPDPKLPDAEQVFHPLEIGPNAGDLATLDPALIYLSQDYQLAQLIFPQLVTLDEQQRPMDWAAQSHEVSSDGLTSTFHLRAGMTWSDGTPIDATTFAYAINRSEDPCTHSVVASYLYAIKGAQAFNNGRCPEGATKSRTSLIGSSLLVPDPLTLQILLERPAGYFLSALTTPVSWGVPRTLIERYTTPPDATHPYGVLTWTDHLLDNGPVGGNLFTLTRWQHQASSPDGLGHLTFARNERFWGKKPLLKEIQYTLYIDSGLEWSAYATGAGDAGFLGAGDLDIARNLTGSTLHQTPQLAIRYLALDWRVAPFDDTRMRKAFALALDRQTIVHGIYHDTVQATIHFLPEGLAGYNPDLIDAVGRKRLDALAPDMVTAQRLAIEYAADKCGGQFARCPPLNYYRVANGSPIALADAQMLAQLQAAFPGWRIAFYDSCRTQVCVSQPFHIRSIG